MWTLALETASAQGSWALLRDGEVVTRAGLAPREHAATLIPALDRGLTAQGIGLDAVGLLAVADGPGSFTGVRIGLTTVKALMEARKIPAVAVSTLAAVAAQSEAGPVLAALDAGRGEVYWGEFPGGEEGVEASAAFAARLSAWQGAAVTPDAALIAAHPRLGAVAPWLAPWVGKLAWAQFQAGGLLPAPEAALRLDARYYGTRWNV